jgi:aspartyl-tRNA(Asn)/glutamyl-tRNA(Gln) amidotransferase subunit C
MSDADSVRRVARLARIHLEENEVEAVARKFQAVLDSFKFLEEAATEGVEPLYHAVDRMEPREDVPEAPMPTEELLRNAPEQVDNCFRLPKVVGAVES